MLEILSIICAVCVLRTVNLLFMTILTMHRLPLKMSIKDEKNYDKLQDEMTAELKQNKIKQHYSAKHTDIAKKIIEKEIIDADKVTDKHNISIDESVVENLGKTYYADSGIKNFTVSVTCKFYYNGKRAWYKSGLDGYYKRHGWINPWSVSRFKTIREKDGSAYEARCSGNFYIQFGFKGVGFKVQDWYIKHTLRCNKNGVIKKSCKMY